MRCKDKLHLILGFSAGALLGVSFFDLLPEAINLGGAAYSMRYVTGTIAVAFLAYMVVDRFAAMHPHEEGPEGHHMHRGRLGAGTLSVHSFLDGLAIGLAFQVSASVGAIVAIAVLVHDFSDGINTVNMVVKNGGSNTVAFRWLLVDATAPLVGVLSTMFFSIPERVLGLVLSVFCGFFLYIGASDLLPESFHGHPTKLTTSMTVLGAAVIATAIWLVG